MVRLGEIFTIASGGTPDKKKSSYYMGGTIPWVKTGDLKGQYVAEGVECITEEGLNNSSAKLFPPNTVLLAMYGATIGACSILHYEASTNQACAAFLPNEKVLPTYLYYFLLSKKDQFVSDGVGGAQPNISGGYLKNVQFDLIPLEQQKAIAARMDKVAELIALRKEQLAKLDQLVKSRFIELFGSVEDNVFGLRTVKIKNACDLINGKAFKPEDWSDTGLPIVRIQNLNNDQAPFNFFNGEIKEQYLIDTGELLFSWSGTPGTSFGAFFWNRGKAVLNQHIFRVKPKIEFNLSFLQFALNGRIDYIISKAHGGVGLQHITKKELDEVELLLPAIELQNQFAAFVEQTDKSKLAIQQSLDKLELLKKSLMQEYFGEGVNK